MPMRTADALSAGGTWAEHPVPFLGSFDLAVTRSAGATHPCIRRAVRGVRCDAQAYRTR